MLTICQQEVYGVSSCQKTVKGKGLDLLAEAPRITSF